MDAKIKKCSECGSEYILNQGVNMLPKAIQEMLKYIPSCECADKKRELEFKLAEEQMEEERKQNKIKIYKDVSITDEKFKECSFETADMTDKHMALAKRYAEKFIEKNGFKQGIIFYGNCGTGKTFASACISNHLMKHGKTVLALSLNNYLNKIRRDQASAEMELQKHIISCDLLVIDDVGSENKTEWVMEKIFSLLDTRYRTGKPIIITTNLTFDDDDSKCEFNRAFSIDGKNRIKDRVREICYPQEVVGDTKRKFKVDNFKDFLK